MLKNKNILWLVFAAFIPVSVWAAPPLTFDDFFPACAHPAGQPDSSTVLSLPSGEVKCHIQPVEQIVKFYRMMACTSAPVAPDTSTAANLANCKPVFTSTNATGSPVSIARGTAQAISDVTIGSNLPGSGPYTHLYLEISPTTTIKASFSSALGFQSAAGASSGQYCKTIDNTYFDWETNSADKLGIECRNTPAYPDNELGTNTITYNSVGGANNFSLTNLPTSSYGPSSLAVYLIDSTGKLIGTGNSSLANGVAKASAILTLTTAISIPSNVSGFEIGWNNSRGAGLNKGDSAVGTPAVGGFDPGPFDMTLTLNTN